MGFSDVGARFKKLAADKEREQAEQERQAADPAEVNALRARMLGVLIRDARIDAGYSVEAVATELEVPSAQIVDWEFGRDTPSLPQLELLGYFLQVPVSHFWGTETMMFQRSQRSIDGQEYMRLRDHMIGVQLRTQREKRGETREAVAERVGIEPATLEAFEIGQQAVPMVTLVHLASVLEVNLNYFLEAMGRIAEFFQLQELMKVFADMPEDVRSFVSVPANQAYIRLAMSLAEMPTDALRTFAEGLLDITL